MVEVNKKLGVSGGNSVNKPRKADSLSLTLSGFFLKNSAFFALLGAFTVLSNAAESFSPVTLPNGPHLGFLYDHFSLTLAEGERTELLGPLFGWQRSGNQRQARLFTFSPVFSLYRDASVDQTEAELLYPILSYDRFGGEYRFQLFQVIAFAGGESLKGEEKDRTTIFPFYFRQKSENPDDNYIAVVPFYGRLKNRLFRDRVFFVMLPLYVQSEKRGVVTDNYVYPFFHRRYGNGVKGWQFWPLVGHERKQVTVSTNNWGDQVLSGGHEKFFALWPFYFNNTLGIGTTNVQKQFVLIPFYTSQVSSNRVSKSYGFPLGYTHTIDREKKYEEHDMPWPLVVFAHGEGKTARRVWPLFSQAKTPTHQSDWYAWPIYKYNRITSAPLDRERTRILFFLYSDLVERNTTRNTALRRRDFWPLFTWRKDHENNERLQVLALLEPLLPNNKSIERLYSPAYSLYRQERNGENGDTSRSFLWNLYRSERRGEVRRTSALFGLFQREKGAGGTRWRIFYVPFGKQEGNGR